MTMDFAEVNNQLTEHIEYKSETYKDCEFTKMYHTVNTESMDKFEIAKYFYELGENSKSS